MSWQKLIYQCGALMMAALISAPRASAFHAFVSTSVVDPSAHQQALQKLFREFQAKHPDIPISLTIKNDHLRPVSELLTQAGSAPTADLIVAGISDWQILQRKKLLRPLSAVLTTDELASIRARLSAEAQTRALGRGIIADDAVLPFSRDIPMMFINLDLFPNAPTGNSNTWPEFIARLRKLRELKSLQAPLVIPFNTWIIESLLVSATGKPSASGKEAHFTEYKAVELFRELKKLRDEGLVRFAGSTRHAVGEFGTGKAAALLASHLTKSALYNRVKFSYRSSLPPTYRHKVALVGGADLALNGHLPLDQTKKQHLATFLRWFYLEGGAALWVSSGGSLPLTKSSATSERSQAKLQGFLALDEYCNIPHIRQLMLTGFKQAIAEDPAAALSSLSKGVASALNKRPCP